MNYIPNEYYDINRSCAQRQYHGKEEGCRDALKDDDVLLHLAPEVYLLLLPRETKQYQKTYENTIMN
jgi:hypothetical protein